MQKPPVIAIDGPAGAGKSTVAKELARRLGFTLLDTGAIYRTVALAARERGLDLGNGPALAELASTLPIAFELRDGASRIRLRGRDVTQDIRSPDISEGASKVSAIREVRAALLGLQRIVAAAGGVVAEGRDMGTVVFPAAEFKFFLTADPGIRAQRRFEEDRQKGGSQTLEQTRSDLEARDERDASRPVAPLVQAQDAILIDSSHLTVDGVVAKMMEVVEMVDKAGESV